MFRNYFKKTVKIVKNSGPQLNSLNVLFINIGLNIGLIDLGSIGLITNVFL